MRSVLEFFSSAIDDRPDPLQDLMRDAHRQGLAVSQRTFPPDRFHLSIGWLELTAFALAVLGPVYNDIYDIVRENRVELERNLS